MKIEKWLGHFCAALLAVQVMVVLWGVLTRYLLGNQAGWTEELARFLLIWISLLGAAYAVARRSHIAIQLLPDRLGADRRKRLYRLIDALILLFAFFVLVIGGGYYVWLTFYLGQRAPSLKLPVGVFYLAVPLSGVLITYFKAKDLINGRT